jgi:hypothetical protein
LRGADKGDLLGPEHHRAQSNLNSLHKLRGLSFLLVAQRRPKTATEVVTNSRLSSLQTSFRIFSNWAFEGEDLALCDHMPVYFCFECYESILVFQDF